MRESFDMHADKPNRHNEILTNAIDLDQVFGEQVEKNAFYKQVKITHLGEDQETDISK